MHSIKGWAWAAVGLLIAAHLLVALLTQFIPLIIVGFVLAGIYSFMFKKRW